MKLTFAQYCGRKHAEDARFTMRGLAPQFAEFWESGDVIEVKHAVRGLFRGTVSITTGYDPVFLLVCDPTVDAGSHVLHHDDAFVRVV